MKQKLSLLAACALLLAALACSEWIPEYTPNPPQQTADWSNTQIVAGTATEIAAWTGTPNETVSPTLPPTTSGQTATPTPTSSPPPSATSSINEVTRPAIIETGYATMPPPNEIVMEAGKYTPYGPQNVRQCANRDCPIVGSLEAYRAYNTAAWLINENREVWLCRKVLEDTHGAQLCDGAVIWIGTDQKYGRYEVVQ